MNYLAHAYLARHDDDAMVGAILGDFVKADAVDGFDPVIAREIRLHWRVDAFTDAHEVTRSLKQRFDAGHRRFAGIVLDLYFDHLLARAWPRYSDAPLPVFCARVYAGFGKWRYALPERAQAAGDPMATQDWLGGYGDPGAMREAVGRVAARLSRNGDVLLACLDAIERDPQPVEQGFELFFPELVAFAEEARRSCLA